MEVGKFWVMKEEDEERRKKKHIEDGETMHASTAQIGKIVPTHDSNKGLGTARKIKQNQSALHRGKKKKILASRFVKETFRKSNKAANFVPDEKQHNGTASVFLLKGMYRQPPTRQPLSILRKLHFQQTLRSTLDHRVHREKLTLKLSLVFKFARHITRNIRRLPTDLQSVFSNTTNKPHEHKTTPKLNSLYHATFSFPLNEITIKVNQFEYVFGISPTVPFFPIPVQLF